MLYAKPTPKGTGIEFWGDFYDLTSLYNTFSVLSYSEFTNPETYARNEQLLSIIPYEIRHAFQGDFLVNDKIDNGNAITTYYGFKTDWITLLYSISALRYNAGLQPTNELIQSNLFLLEYCTRTALHDYDAKGANIIETFINDNINVRTKYLYHIHQRAVMLFFSYKPGVKRFRNIPNILSQFQYGSFLDNFIKGIEDFAKENNCDIKDVIIDDNYDYIIS